MDLESNVVNGISEILHMESAIGANPTIIIINNIIIIIRDKETYE